MNAFDSIKQVFEVGRATFLNSSADERQTRRAVLQPGRAADISSGA
jgi:hypothetical protein